MLRNVNISAYSNELSGSISLNRQSVAGCREGVVAGRLNLLK